MFKTLRKFWPAVSVVCLLGLLASLFFWPAGSRWVGWIVLIFSIGMAIALIVQQHLQAYRKGRISRRRLVRLICTDVAGTLLAILAAILLTGKIASSIGLAAARAAEKTWPGAGNTAGILASLLSGVVVGLGVGFLVRWLWGIITRPKQPAPAQDKA